MDVQFNADELRILGQAFLNLPGEVKAKAFARAMRRMRDMAKTRIVRLSSDRVDLPRSVVRSMTTASFNAGRSTIDIVEEAGWIALFKLGATPTPTGIMVKGRGERRHAFIATLKSGHKGVFLRQPGTKMDSNPKKEKIRELFGPNPAHDITNNPDVFMKVLVDLIEDHLAPRVLHELERILPK